MFAKSNVIYFLAVILNIIISYMMLLYRQPFNVDGILYLHAAEVYLQHGLHASMQIYPWPFYSILIATVSQISHLSLLASAFLINAVLTSFLVCFFLLLISACGGTLSHQYWGVLIILLYPLLNHDRQNVLRDFGYYAFFLGSLWCLIKFFQENKNKYAFFWQIFILIASAFRIEGIILLLLVPLASKKMNILKLSWFNLLLFILALLISSSILHFGRLPEIMANLQINGLVTFFQQKLIIIQDQILGIFGKDDALFFLISGLIGVFLVELLQTFGIFSAILLLFGIKKKIIYIESRALRAIIIYGVIVLLILIGFLVHQLFLTNRYVIPLALLLMLTLPFIAAALWKHSFLSKILLCLWLIFNAVSSFGQFGPSKTYIIDAGEWMNRNIPSIENIYINDAQLAYYANRSGTQLPLDANIFNNFKNYKYIAVVITHHDENYSEQKWVQLIGQEPIKIFQNNKGDRVLIFKPLLSLK
jgi:hypothetical protein